jgi:2-isopropylmalate synthase
LKHKLRISREECIARATAAVAYARSLGCNDVEFSPEDAGRSDKDFLCAVLGAVIQAGATTLNIPDTVGYNTPEEFGAMMKYLIANTPGSDKVTWSTHCHNDLGLATANTLSGILNGARQVEVTINGIGERAGNTSLEEVVMAIQTHPSTFPVYHDIDTQQIYITSQLVTKKTGMIIQPNKAIVGANAFAHESGIHQDGMLKNKQTYEIIQPETIGLPSSLLVLGKHSGRNAFKTRLEQMLGESVYADRILSAPEKLESLFQSFKKLADTKKSGVTEQDLYALLDDKLNTEATGRETYKLKSVQVVSGTGVLATATVSLIELVQPNSSSVEGGSTSPAQNASDPSGNSGADHYAAGGMASPSSAEELASSPNHAHGNNVAPIEIERMDAAIGHGPVHAIFSAINRLVGIRNVLASYEVKAVTEGSDSLGKVVVTVHESDEEESLAGSKQSGSGADGSVLAHIPRHGSDLDLVSVRDKNMYRGDGIDEDILVASGKAYINALNRMLDVRRRKAAESLKESAGSAANGLGLGFGKEAVAVPASRKVDV